MLRADAHVGDAAAVEVGHALLQHLEALAFEERGRGLPVEVAPGRELGDEHDLQDLHRPARDRSALALDPRLAQHVLLHDHDARAGRTRLAVAPGRPLVLRELGPAVVPERVLREARPIRLRCGRSCEPGERERDETQALSEAPLQVILEVPHHTAPASASWIASTSAPNCLSKKWVAPGISTSFLGSAQRPNRSRRAAGGHTTSSVPCSTSLGTASDSSPTKLELRTGGAIRIRRSIPGSADASRDAIQAPKENPAIQP